MRPETGRRFQGGLPDDEAGGVYSPFPPKRGPMGWCRDRTGGEGCENRVSGGVCPCMLPAGSTPGRGITYPPSLRHPHPSPPQTSPHTHDPKLTTSSTMIKLTSAITRPITHQAPIQHLNLIPHTNRTGTFPSPHAASTSAQKHFSDPEAYISSQARSRRPTLNIRTREECLPSIGLIPCSCENCSQLRD